MEQPARKRQIVGPDGKPAAAASRDPILIGQYASRKVKITDLVHVTNGEGCLPCLVAHVSVNSDSVFDGMVIQANGPAMVRNIGYMQEPQLLTGVAARRIVSWHWPAICPWGR